jgi:hypothetical protein
MDGLQNSLGTLIWSGEHWINYLRPPRAESDSGMVSLYHAHYSSAGEGTVAFVDIAGNPGFTGVCTDNRELAEFISETMIRGRGNPFDRDLPVLDAAITRSGDVRSAPFWTIRVGEDCIVATWEQIQPPLVGPPTLNESIVFTVLCFADEGGILLNGKPVVGRPYLREIWRQSLGKAYSSCVFALAETMIQPPKVL